MDSILTQGGIDLKCSQHWIRRASERATAPNWIPYRFSRDPGTLVIILNSGSIRSLHRLFDFGSKRSQGGLAILRS